MERPNTVSGLIAKRAELMKLRHYHDTQVKKLICDINHLNAAIALFDPSAKPRAPQPYAVQHKARKGSVSFFVMNHFREAVGPVTSREIAEAWIKAHSLTADEATFAIVRKRIGACLKVLQAKGLLRSTVQDGIYKAWMVA